MDIEDYYDWAGFWTGYGSNMRNVSRDLFPNSRYEVGNSVTTEWVSHQNASYYNNTPNFQKQRDRADQLAETYYGAEQINAAYVMSTQNLGSKWSIIGGLRIEQSKLEYEANNYNKRLDKLGARLKATSDFLDFMPALHFKYTPNKKVVGRFAYTRTISRPAYGSIAPKMNVSIKDKTVSEGNPNLKPALSNNFDLLGEYYPGGTALISGGIYLKNISNYVVTVKDRVKFSTVKQWVLSPTELAAEVPAPSPTVLADYKRYYDPLNNNDELLERTKPINAGKANILGTEIALQKKLTFLPGILSNLSVFANYTHNWIFTKENEPKLPGTASNILNVSLAYETPKFDARLSFNNTSAFSTITGIQPEGKGDIYYDKVYYLDANVNVYLSKKWVIYANANNLLNQAQRRYMWRPEYTYSSLYTGTTGQAGIKFNLY